MSSDDEAPLGAPAPAAPALGSSPPLDASVPAVDPTKSPTATKPLLVALATTIAVTAVSLLTPEKYAATAVGVVFLAVTWLFVLRGDEELVRAHGLSLGGVLEPRPIEPKRAARDALEALAWTIGLAAIVFPPFYFGYRFYYHAHAHFAFKLPRSIADEVAGQLLVIAMPEEAFYRGYLQSALDRAWPRRVRVLGAEIGPSLVVTSAIFAIGHLLTVHSWARLAVFFPALLFGWLRARTKGVGAGVVFHASCNLFSALLARGFGLA